MLLDSPFISFFVKKLRVEPEEWVQCLRVCNNLYTIVLSSSQGKTQWLQTVHSLLMQLSAAPVTSVVSSSSTTTHPLAACLTQTFTHIMELQSQFNTEKETETEKLICRTLGSILVFTALLSNRYPLTLSAAWKLIKSTLLNHKRALLVAFDIPVSSLTKEVLSSDPPFTTLFNSLFSLIQIAFSTLEDTNVQETKRKLAEKTLKLTTPILCILVDCFGN